ncbi:ATP-dependent DNA helicase 2 subunit 1-like isoform X2 [Apis laboriosa]|uniref:ATP-dependent DNA helicase 2 subunit 1-like isoform X2 n=1 Tax=Apis laboriosa TaxID=183418 RepID=UPI001CC82072|nr:ATP-dependent DNA helicase 2 subunit 1-like isoform X2 [Apis laboriosa]
MASFNEEDLENEDYEDDSKDLYGVRDGILFLIDATPPMFKNDPQNGIPYFLQCIKQYKEILKQKLVWNRQDWMGLILFGTEKYDSDSETKNILILKKLNLISKDDLKDVMKIDLEMLSGKIEADDYKRTSLKDLVEQVKLPSRNMAKLPWRLGENVTIDVSLRNLSVKTQYLHKENISKQTNIPLTTRTYFKVDKDDIMTEEIDDIENKRTSSSVLEMDIRKYQNFGLEKIYFTQAEVRSLSTMREPGIDLICIKHISYHLLYHVETPYFVIPSKSNRKDNKLLFGALLNKCDSKKLMIICAVTIRSYSASSLYTMIPNVNNGGFYLYKMPFRENVRDLSEYFSEFIYNHNERKPPIEPNAVELLKNIMKKLNIEYNPKLFSNPKLQVQLQIVETLALDLEQFKSLPDDTFPKTEEIHKLVKDLLDEYDKIFNEETEDNIPKKKRKNVRK